jgi:hypothetical protein
MFTKKEDLLDSKSFSKTKVNMFTISKFNGTRLGDTASSKTKQIAQKSAPFQDLSLNSLTKEL